MNNTSLIIFIALLAFLGVAIAVAAFLGYQYAALRSNLGQRLADERERWRASELAPALRAQVDASRQESAARFRQWRDQELEAIRAQTYEVARREAQVQLEQWKTEHETSLRLDAAQRSRAVTVGKMTEHLVPYLPGFEFDPGDCRFLGSPVDLCVFDGLCDGDGPVREVVFVEVKTGNSTLSTRERRVRDAVQAGRVRWLELRPDTHMQAAFEERN